jgi:hypothetical protein
MLPFLETHSEAAHESIYSQAGAPVNARSEAPFSQTPLDVAQLYGLDAPHPVGRSEILLFILVKCIVLLLSFPEFCAAGSFSL